MMRRPLVAAALAATLFAVADAHAADPQLIPRAALFGNPDRARPQISPDAKRLAWLAADPKGVLQVWVKTLGKSDDKMVTADKHRGIRMYWWAWDDRHLLYMQDSDGDENFHVYSVDLVDGNVRDLTPFQGVKASIEGLDRKFPNLALVSMNARKRELFDVYRVDLTTGALTMEAENPGDVAGWIEDDQLVTRGASIATPAGGTELRVRANAKAPWKTLLTVGPEENVDFAGFSKDGKSVYLTTSFGRDTTRLVLRPLDKPTDEKELAGDDAVDVGPILMHPVARTPQAVGFLKGRLEWKLLDPSLKADAEAISKLDDGDWNVSSRDRADNTWIVTFNRDHGAIHWYSYDRATKKGTFLFAHQPALDKLPLQTMKPVDLKARDGMTLHAYLTVPAGTAKNLPMVLLVHGGPWARDDWGFDAEAQLLANRGYAVLQVNFRGSEGYGKKYLHAGDKQWGLAMHDDLIDAVRWAVAEGIADPKRVAIMGGSYGGYSALAGAAFTPDVFRCAVDIVGPSNLFTLLATIPPYWKPIISMFHARVGNPDVAEDKELLKKASPLYAADHIRIPLLIAQGANDPRVKQAESDQILKAVADAGGRATYVLYADEGHGFARPPNRLDFYARAEKFLAEHLGGRAEPQAGDKEPGSTAVVRVVGPGKK